LEKIILTSGGSITLRGVLVQFWIALDIKDRMSGYIRWDYV